MLSLSRIRVLLGLVVVAGVLMSAPVSRGQAAKKPTTKNVTFKSFDGVELSGTFYPNSSGKKDATVLLLHDFDLNKGGSSQQEGWSDLAAALQADGYAVLMFDFRGFGDSKSVNNEVFWKYSTNAQYIRGNGALRKSEQIEYRNFITAYIPYLVNDIAAARAYLDRQNDQKSCNTSSLIVIGAGEGATLGALWMAHECRRRKDRNPPNPLLLMPPMLGEPEGKDIAAGIWLTISPTLGKRTVPLRSWLLEAGGEHRIPMAFIFGTSDGKNDNIGTGHMKAIKSRLPRTKEANLTGVKAIPDTKLANNRLLDRSLETRGWIIKDYLGPVMEARGNREWVERKGESSFFWYTPQKSSRPLRINKKPGEEAPAVDLRLFMQ